MRTSSYFVLASLALTACGTAAVDLPSPETMFIAVPGASELRRGETPACEGDTAGYVALLDHSMDFNWAIIDQLHLLPQLSDATRSGDHDRASWTVQDDEHEVVFTATRQSDGIAFTGACDGHEFATGQADELLTSGTWTVRTPANQLAVAIAWRDNNELTIDYEAIGARSTATFRSGSARTVEFRADVVTAVAEWNPDTLAGHIAVDGGERACWCSVGDAYCSTDC